MLESKNSFEFDITHRENLYIVSLIINEEATEIGSYKSLEVAQIAKNHVMKKYSVVAKHDNTKIKPISKPTLTFASQPILPKLDGGQFKNGVYYLAGIWVAFVSDGEKQESYPASSMEEARGIVERGKPFKLKEAKPKRTITEDD